MVTELGYSVPDVARQLGCSTAAIHRWKTDATPLDPEVSQRMLLGEDENKRLRKENSRLKMEVEILKRMKSGFGSAMPGRQRPTGAENSGSIRKRW
jgi:transposase-like protein